MKFPRLCGFKRLMKTSCINNIGLMPREYRNLQNSSEQFPCLLLEIKTLKHYNMMGIIPSVFKNSLYLLSSSFCIQNHLLLLSNEKQSMFCLYYIIHKMFIFSNKSTPGNAFFMGSSYDFLLYKSSSSVAMEWR